MSDKNMFSTRYKLFFEELMINEGWESNDSLDSGGHTIAGITEKFYPLQHSVLVNMIKEKYSKESIMDYIRMFYYSNFYNPLYDQLYDSSLSFKIFDFGVNAGIKKSIKILQRTNNKNNYEQLKVDGKFGPNTLRVVNSFGTTGNTCSETDFYDKYIVELEKYYKSLWNFFRFGKGWLNRLKRIFNKATDL